MNLDVLALHERAAAVKVMGFDVDGVLTDGRLYFGPEGDTLKTFHTRDGHGLKLLRAGGIEPVVISGRRNAALTLRCQELGVVGIFGVEDKVAAMAQLLSERRLDFSCAGYMGDDVVDLPLMRRCRFAAAPADAHPEVRLRAHWISAYPGGSGAVRELCEHLLRASGAWSAVMKPYLGDAP